MTIKMGWRPRHFSIVHCCRLDVDVIAHPQLAVVATPPKLVVILSEAKNPSVTVLATVRVARTPSFGF